MSFVDELEQHLTGGIVIDGRRRKRRRRAIVSVATVVVAGLMALGGWTILTDEPSTQVATDVGERTPTTPTATGEASDPTLPVPGPDPVDDEARPDAAQRSLEMVGTVTVWTGSELFVWGGATTYEAAAMPDNPGIRYEPTSDTWRELPPAPGGPQTEAVGVWTGSEVIVCCGRTTDGVGGDGGGAVAYRPDTDNWRELAEPPLDQPAGAVWLDGRMYVISRFVMAAYDPGTDTWERLAAPPSDTALSTRSPIIAVDDAIVVWPLRPSRTVSEGMVYDPTTDTWSMLPSPPDGYHPAMTDVAWTGEELIVVGGLPAPFADDSERLVGARLDWATKTWTPLPDVWPEPLSAEGNLGSASIVWTGEVAVVAAGALGTGVDPIDGAIATYNPATDQWRRLPTPGDWTWTWNPPLIAVGDEILAVSAGTLRRIDTSADVGEPVGGTGMPAVVTPPVEEVGVRDLPLTLVGTNGNGGGIVVLDLDHGVRTVYESGRHHRLGGALTDLAMVGDWLYVWQTDGPTVRFSNEATSFGLNRLTFGELTQPGEVVQSVGGGERAVLPVPSSNLLWSWEVEAVPGGSEATARLLSLGGDPATEALVEVRFDDTYAAWGVGADGDLVVTTDDGKVFAITPDGRQVDLGSGTVVAVAGNEVLIQTCSAGECGRRRFDLGTERMVRLAPADDRSWMTANGEPIIPGHSRPLNAVSPDGSQILVTTRSAGDTTDAGPAELRRVDLATDATEAVPLPDDFRSTLATWSRDGRYVVAIDGGGSTIVTVDLRTGLVDRHDGVIPEGFFVLAAG